MQLEWCNHSHLGNLCRSHLTVWLLSPETTTQEGMVNVVLLKYCLNVVHKDKLKIPPNVRQSTMDGFLTSSGDCCSRELFLFNENIGCFTIYVKEPTVYLCVIFTLNSLGTLFPSRKFPMHYQLFVAVLIYNTFLERFVSHENITARARFLVVLMSA